MRLAVLSLTLLAGIAFATPASAAQSGHPALAGTRPDPPHHFVWHGPRHRHIASGAVHSQTYADARGARSISHTHPAAAPPLTAAHGSLHEETSAGVTIIRGPAIAH
jgi:hypothetical protein